LPTELENQETFQSSVLPTELENQEIFQPSLLPTELENQEIGSLIQLAIILAGMFFVF
jgi:hypothetical protein